MTVKRNTSKPRHAKPGKGKAKGMKTGKTKTGNTKDIPESDAHAMRTDQEVEELVQRARSGDAQALPGLRECLNQRPGLWVRYGHLAVKAQEAWIDKMAGKDLYARECLRRQVNQMKRDLVGDSDDPLQSLQADEIIMAWLRHYYHDVQEALTSPNSPEWAKFRLGRMRISIDRLDKAIQGMAKLRKLLPPPPTQAPAAPESTATPKQERRSPQTKKASSSRRRGTSRGSGHATADRNGHTGKHVNRLQTVLCAAEN